MKRLMTMVLAGFAGVCSAATINVPADQATIAEAITAASAEDEIVLAVGTHYIDANLQVNKKLTIRGATGNRDDVIVEPAAGKSPNQLFNVTTSAGTVIRDLIRAAEMLGEKPDPMWKDVESRLPQYAVAKQTSCVRRSDREIGLFDGKRLPESHRHHSHMAGLVPFDTIDFEGGKATHELVEETYTTWIQHGKGLWAGWSMPWAAMLYAHIGAADAAALTLKEWKTVFNNPGHGSRHNPYYPGLSLIWKHPFDSAGEGEEEIMQMDGAAASVAAVLYMLCHERNGVIRLFFGAPSEWKDVSFENILTDGGFLVSATRRGGQIAGLTVTAMRNGTFRYTLTGKESDAVSVKMSAGETWRQCP